MLRFRLSLYAAQNKALTARLRIAEQLGDIGSVKRILAIQLLSEGVSKKEIASMLKVSAEAVRLWLRGFLLRGVKGLETKKPPGRPSRLTKSQKRELGKIIDQGPAKAGFNGNCWRSPMIQHLIYKKFAVVYSVYYICQLLKNMGFS